MSFSEIAINDNNIIINFPNDNHNNFLRCHFWLEKLSDYDYFPKIIEIDYFQKIIKAQLTNISNKTFKEQIIDIESILNKNNCQLNNILENHIYIWKKTIYILNFEWCIDLLCDINEEINFWEYSKQTVHILRSKFIENKVILNNILKNKGIDFRFDTIIMIFFIKNLETFNNNYTSMNILLNYCNYLIINEEIDNFKLKLELNNYPNIEVINDNSQNIFDNIELFQYICKTNKDKKYLLSINLNYAFEYSIIYKYIDEIDKNKDIGMVYYDNCKYIGIYGNLKWSVLLKKICQIFNIDYSYLLSDENEFIDWVKYEYGNTLQEKKKHWLFEGIENINIKLPIKYGNEMDIPRIPLNPNFIINLDIYNTFFNTYSIKKEYDNELYFYFLCYFIFYSKKKYKVIEK